MTETLSSARTEASAARRAALRPVIVPITAFLVVSAAMVAALIALTSIGAPVSDTMWIRCSLVLASSIVLLTIARAAARGARSAFLRLRVIAPVVLVAIVVIVAIPGLLPGWVRLEQALCGLILLPAVVVLLRRRTAALFPRVAAPAPRPAA